MLICGPNPGMAASNPQGVIAVLLLSHVSTQARVGQTMDKHRTESSLAIKAIDIGPLLRRQRAVSGTKSSEGLHSGEESSLSKSWLVTRIRDEK